MKWLTIILLFICASINSQGIRIAGNTIKTVNLEATGTMPTTISFFCTADSISENADSVGYAIVKNYMDTLELQDVQVSSFNDADRVVSVDVYKIRNGSRIKMTSTAATLGAEYTVSDEVIDATNKYLKKGDVVYIRWEQAAGATRHYGLFVGLDFQ
jgi:hypothetical protein